MKFGIALLAGMLGLFFYPPKTIIDSQLSNKPKFIEVAAKDWKSPPGLISIEQINLRAKIEAVGLGEDKLMIVPANNTDVSWYKWGPRPGEDGWAVLAGHNEWEENVGVFGRLKELQTGNLITITNKDGQEIKFEIEEIKSYPTEEFPTEEIYTSRVGKKLILITCHGKYQKASGYNQRLVVKAKVI